MGKYINFTPYILKMYKTTTITSIKSWLSGWPSTKASADTKQHNFMHTSSIGKRGSGAGGALELHP